MNTTDRQRKTSPEAAPSPPATDQPKKGRRLLPRTLMYALLAFVLLLVVLIARRVLL